MKQYWRGPLIVGVTDGPSRASSTAENSLLNPEEKYLLGPNDFLLVGTTLVIWATGRISNIVTTPGTLTLKVNYGATNIWSSGAIQLNAVAKTTVPWELNLTLPLRVLGSAANFFGMGNFQSESVVGSPLPSAGGNGSLLVPVGTPAVGTNVDLTAAGALDLTATFSISNAANLIQKHNYTLELVN